MDVKEFEKSLEDLKTKANEKALEIAKAESGELKEELLKKLVELKEASKEFGKANEIAELKDHLNKIDAKIQAKNANERKNMNFKDAFVSELVEKKDNVEKFLNKEINSLKMELKDVSLADTLFAVGSESQVSVTTNTGIISPIRSRVLTYLQSGVSVGSIGGTKAMWVEELDETGTIIPTAELATKPDINVRYEERDAKVEKYPAFAKVSTELMQDAPQLASAVQNNVLKRLNLKIESDLFTGDGTSNAINGIAEYATAFNGGTLNGTLPANSAQNYDVIRAIALQVQEAFGTAGAVFVDHGKLAEMELKKGADDQYIMPPFKSADGNTIAGVRLIGTSAFVGDATIDFVGGDLSVVNVLFREGVNLQIDRSGDDFINNKMTILAEARMVQFVSANDTGLLVKGTFDAAKTALETA